MIKLFIPIVPMGAVRTTQRQKWVDKRAQRYFTYKQQIALLAKQYIHTPSDKPILVDIAFYMPIPDSWSKKKKERFNGAVHTSKADIDNLIKGCFDAINKIAWQDDRQVYEVHSRKMYSFNPGIALEIWELEDEDHDEQNKAKTSTAKAPSKAAKRSV